MPSRSALDTAHAGRNEKPIEAPESRASRQRDWFWLVLLVLPPFLIFPRLGQPLLWQDEAETALLGRSVLEHGYPLATGERIISDQPGRADLNASGVWIWSPWLQHYAVALAFALFGISAWAARLPFALAGWASLLVSYATLIELSRNRRLCRYALVLLLGSVPFLLHVRQCRYYAPLALASMLQLLGYLRLTREGRGGATLFCCGGIGVYYTFFPQLVASTAAMCIHALLYHRRRRFLVRLGILCGAIAAATLPFFIYTRSWSRNYQEVGYGFESVPRYLSTLRAYLLQIHVYAWPALILVPVLWTGRPGGWLLPTRFILTACALVWVVAVVGPPGTLSFVVMAAATAAALVWLGRDLIRHPERFARFGLPVQELALAVLVSGVSVLFFAGVSNFPFFRYLIGLLPLFALATASSVLALAPRPWIAVALTGCLLACDLLHLGVFSAAHWAVGGPNLGPFPVTQSDGSGFLAGDVYSESTLRLREPLPRITSWIREYAYELTHDYAGPVSAVVGHLRANARPGDTLVTSYEHFSLMFHTDLRVYSYIEALDLAREPDWVFVHGMHTRLPRDLIAALKDPARYERVSLAGFDFLFENVPEPTWHRFRSPSSGPPLTLFHRRR